MRDPAHEFQKETDMNRGVVLSRKMPYLLLQLFFIFSVNSIPYVLMSMVYSFRADVLLVIAIIATGIVFYILMNMFIFVMIRKMDLVLIVMNLFFTLPAFLVVVIFIAPWDIGFSTLSILSLVFPLVSTSYWILWIMS